MSAAAIHDPTHAYRSNARKLRGRFVQRPGELYRSLRQLSDCHDQIRSLQTPVQSPATPTSEFAGEVREFLQTEMLTYTARQNLLKSAEMRNIPRFEANLIIAAMQHRVPICTSAEPTLRASQLPLALGIVFGQLALVIVVWALATL
jgi:hypothetical protein